MPSPPLNPKWTGVTHQRRTMTDRPHLTHGFERASLLLDANRLAELTFHDLTPEERQIVLDELEAKLVRTHRRAVRAHVVGALLTIGFAALSLFVFVIGPIAHIGPTGQVRTTDLTLEAQMWAVGLALVSLGIAAFDYLLRRRRSLAHGWERESKSIARAIGRAGVREPDGG